MKLTAFLIGGEALGVDLQTWSASDLSGSLPFLIEDTVSTGYEDISSITNFNKFGLAANADYAKIRTEIKALVDATGYANLSDAEKKIALRWFVAGSGNDYIDTLYTQAEHAINFDIFKESIDNCRKNRDRLLSRYLMQNVYQGIVSQADVEMLIYDVRTLRDSWVTDGLAGFGYGDIGAGIMNFLMNDGIFAGQAISAVNDTNDWVEVAGDYMKYLRKGHCVTIEGSTGNDGVYEVENFEFKPSGKTRVTTVENLPDPTVDGTLYIVGLKAYPFYTDVLRDDLFSIYNNGTIN